MKRVSKKLLSLFMVVCLVLGMIPLTAAAEASGCTHDCTDGTCGYIEAVPCGHTHDESCGEDGADCDHDCADGTCGYIEGAPCGHIHDENCGGLATGDSGDPAPRDNTVKTITDFDPLPVATLEAATGTALGDLLLPDELKATADNAEADVPVQAWQAKQGETAYDKDTAGDYVLVPVFDADYTVADGVALPEILVTLIPPAPGNTAKTVTAFASLDLAVQYQDVVSGALKADLTLPDTLEATVDGQTETIPGVTWSCAAYDEATGMTETEYEWKAALPYGYALAEGVEAPSVFALVDGGGMMAPMALAGDFIITMTNSDRDPVLDLDYTYENNILTIQQDASYTISMAAGVTTTTDRIVVRTYMTPDITLNGISVNASNCAFEIERNCKVNLILEGTNTLKSGTNYSGLWVRPTSTLTIAGTGSLTATGGRLGAGIDVSAGSAITISDGTVTATGGSGTAGGAAGIGGASGSAGGAITISGGTVTATGGAGTAGGAAGIGGGTNGAGGAITISGGTVTATRGSGSNRSDIGPGNNGANGTVTITGGSIDCTSATDKILPQPTNGSASVYLNTLTVGSSANADAAITSGSIGGVVCETKSPPASGYGIKDVKTDASGIVYFYLPAATNENVVLVANGYFHAKSYQRTASGSTETLVRPELTVTKSDANVVDTNIYEFANNIHTIKTNGTYTITGRIPGTTTVERVAVAPGVTTAYIRLNGVNIDVSKTVDACAFDMTGATADLILEGTNTLKSGENRAGLEVPAGATLGIYGGGGYGTDGSLAATGGRKGAGIGGGNNVGEGGNITINGGTVTATGGIFGAGIGGAGGAGGKIGIAGGTVTATGGVQGAGVGGGSYSAGGAITISGSTVTATGGSKSAGVGGGDEGAGGTITISGGTLKATRGSGSNKSDIGPGYDGADGTVTITGGSIYCTGATNKILPHPTNGSADVYLNTLTVGSSANANAAITAGSIGGVACASTPNAATGVYGIRGVNTDASGIVYFYLPAAADQEVCLAAKGNNYVKTYTRGTSGSTETLALRLSLIITSTDVDLNNSNNYVYENYNHTIKVSGAYEITGTTAAERVVVAPGVTANITLNGVSINVSGTDDACAFNLTGATVNLTLTGTNTLKSGKSRAGLQAPSGATLTIAGSGSLAATGGNYGAGIGGGDHGSGGAITVSGGTVTATGGDFAAGLGGGYGSWSDGAGGTITISGGTVKATRGNGSDRSDIGPGNNGANGTVTITGGSIYCTSATNKILPQPTNGSANVYLNTLTVGSSANANAAITVGSIGGAACAETPNAATGVYGIRDVKTNASGIVYFYLPEKATSEKVTLQANGGFYMKTYTRTASGSTETLVRTDLIVTSSSNNIGDASVYSFDNNIHTIKVSGTYSITSSITGITTAERVVVASGVTANIMLNGVSIDVSATSSACAFDMTGATVNLTLIGTNTLKSGANRAGLQAPSGATLTITGSGSLAATGGSRGAGIGGGSDSSGGTITISGDTVTATGGTQGAGIGGGSYSAGGTVTISGGTVTATGGGQGAGVGGGSFGASGAITISGGTVTATGGRLGGAGVGGGYMGAAENITIRGGAVTAQGGAEAGGYGGGGAGIGDGFEGAGGGTITIRSGTVTAQGGTGGAGIGGAQDGAGGTVTISDGTVKATGGGQGAGIGGGQNVSGGENVSGGNITISGGTVTATGGNSGAGIGGGLAGAAENITISGGMVTATGTGQSAGIGGGWGGAGGAVTISGGMVTATRGSSILYDIGPGTAVAIGTVTITGGSVHCTSEAANKIHPQPTNGNGVNVYLNTLTVGIPAIPNTAITAGSIGGVACETNSPPASGYGIKDVKTDASGIVYFYLPAAADQEVSLTAKDNNYVKTYTRTASGSTETLAIHSSLTVTSTNVDLNDSNHYTYENENHTHTIKVSGTYEITGTTTVERVVVASGVTADITLNGVNIDISSSKNEISAFDMADATVNLILVGTNTLKSPAFGAGLHAPSGAALTIAGSGSLAATGGSSSAGIGGGWGGTGGTITINSGTVTATGGSYAAGIGGGGNGRGASTGGTITINGGTVTATGGTQGAGIGSGPDSASGGIITINGGTVTATGREYGAGIGGGYGSWGDGAGGTITISGGTVKATRGGDSNKSDIGPGHNGTNGTVTITGGSIHCTSATNKILPQPTNGNSADVYLNTLTVGIPAVTNTAITAGSIGGVPCDPNSPPTSGYGINDVKTDAAGIVYFYLPEATAQEVSLTANGLPYTKTYARTASGSMETLDTTASDTTPPTLSAVRFIERTSDAAGKLTLTSDEAGTVYYLVLNDGEGAPAKETVAGGTSAGAINASTATQFSVILTAGAKDVYVVVKDAAGNISDASKVDFAAYTALGTAVSWSGLTANGTANTTDTTELTLTFNIEPTGLTAGDITVTGATKGTLSGTGTTRTLGISAITVAEGANVTVAITSPAGYNISPASRTVAVHKAASDVTPPTGEIRVKSSGWTSFWNTITFGLFFKNTTDVTITASDDSGTVKIEYTLSNAELTQALVTALADSDWTEDDSFSINPNSKVIIYARLTDPSGNKAYINSAGIVVYADSAASTMAISFTKGGTQDVTANVTLDGNTIAKILNGTATLNSGTDYTVSGGAITFKASYLDSLAASATPYNLTVHYNPMGEAYVDHTDNDAPATTTIALTVSDAATPALGGTASISGTNGIGQTLTADTSLVTGGSGAFSYQWQAGGVNIGTDSDIYSLTGAEAGKAITCVITRTDATGSVSVTFDSGNTVPYNVTITRSGNSGTDDATLSQSTGRAGSSITLNYTLGNSDTNNTLTFTGATGLAPVTSAGTGTRTYTVTAGDAVNGLITITATFLHTGLQPQTLTFALSGNQTKTFGDANFTNAATGQGIGEMTYTSSNPAVATVTNSGVVTIDRAGSATITANIAPDATYAAATASYTLTVNNASQTAPVGVGKTDETAVGANDGTITGVTAAMEYKLSTDALYTAITGTTVTGLAPGTYQVRYAAKPNYDASPDATVTISAFVSTTVPVTSITVMGAGGATAITTNGGSLQMSASVLPADATKDTVTWSIVPGTGGATISASGLLNATTNGTVTVRATANDGSNVFGELLITISGQTSPAVPVTSITVTGAGGATTISTNGGTLQMLADVQPTTATIQSVTWTVTNGTGSANISTGGLLTATGDGTVTVRATANDGSGISDTLVVTISEQGTTPTITYTITFNANGGSVYPTTMQTGTDGKLSSLPTATRSGSYSFDGWFTASIGGTRVTTSTVFTANTTVYGRWTYTGGNGGGGGGVYIPPTPIPMEELPNMPALAKVSVTGSVKDKVLTAIITEKMAKDAIAAEKDMGNGIAVQFNITGSGDYESLSATFERAALEALKAAGVRHVQIGSTLIDISFDAKAITGILAQTTGDVTVSATRQTMLSDAAKAYIGSRPVFDITIKDASGTTVSDLKGGTATIGIAYKPASTENTGNLYGVYVDKNGKPQLLTNSSYDNGRVIFSRNSLSVYGVGYNTQAAAFTDTQKHWAKDDIDFVASRDLISGTSATTFSPDTAITRADFLMALGKLAGSDVSGYTASSFTDVSNTSSAMPYIEWAVKNGIVQGIGNNQFGPDRLITRQDMTVMMVNYAKATGYTLPVSRQAVTFADDAKISAYAKDAVKVIQQTGVISGKPNNLFDPQGSATRAEAATILRRFVELVIDEGTARGWVQNDSGQ